MTANNTLAAQYKRELDDARARLRELGDQIDSMLRGHRTEVTRLINERNEALNARRLLVDELAEVRAEIDRLRAREGA